MELGELIIINTTTKNILPFTEELIFFKGKNGKKKRIITMPETLLKSDSILTSIRFTMTDMNNIKHILWSHLCSITK